MVHEAEVLGNAGAANTDLRHFSVSLKCLKDISMLALATNDEMCNQLGC
jgi:hypothetical protein